MDAVIDLMERGEEITVGRVVAESGVSRAAIYRRWPSMIELIAAALDRGRVPYAIPTDGDLLENLMDAFTRGGHPTVQRYSEDRFRLRMRLAMSDRRVQRAYWRAHVAGRRKALVAVLQEGIARGELRDDLDIEAGIDLVCGVSYYQFVVRGAAFDDEDAMARCREAIRIAWRGMTT